MRILPAIAVTVAMALSASAQTCRHCSQGRKIRKNIHQEARQKTGHQDGGSQKTGAHKPG